MTLGEDDPFPLGIIDEDCMGEATLLLGDSAPPDPDPDADAADAEKDGASSFPENETGTVAELFRLRVEGADAGTFDMFDHAAIRPLISLLLLSPAPPDVPPFAGS
jgi:hypothetical protein